MVNKKQEISERKKRYTYYIALFILKNKVVT